MACGVLGRGRQGKAEGVERGGGTSAHVLGLGGRDRETMRPLVIVQDPPPASQRVPSVGWIRVAAWGWSRGL